MHLELLHRKNSFVVSKYILETLVFPFGRPPRNSRDSEVSEFRWRRLLIFSENVSENMFSDCFFTESACSWKPLFHRVHNQIFRSFEHFVSDALLHNSIVKSRFLEKWLNDARMALHDQKMISETEICFISSQKVCFKRDPLRKFKILELARKIRCISANTVFLVALQKIKNR